MRYFGGKHRISKDLSAFLNTQLEGKDNFYDLFCGSCNVISKIDPKVNRYANDIRDFMVATMSVRGIDVFPDVVTEEEYHEAKNLPTTDPLHGFILVGCSYAGKYKGTYAKDKTGRNYAGEAKKGLMKKIPLLAGVIWINEDYARVKIKPNSVVYCDIPYHGTVGYGDKFDHDKFYDWVARQEATVFISEYQDSYNPLNLDTVWSKNSVQGLKSKNKTCKSTVEILRRFN